MWKYFSFFLIAGILVLGGFYLFERYSHAKTRKEFNNQVTELQGTLKETETAYSMLAILKDNLKTSNEELRKIIEDREEEVAVLSEINIKLRDRIVEITDATSSVEDSNGNPIEIESDCEECLKDKRFRVDFIAGDDLLDIQGYTLTNPSFVDISFKWRRDIKLNLILTKKNEKFRIYVNSEGSDVESAKLSLSVDPNVFKNKWYQKIGFGTSIGIGSGVQSSVGAYYEITNDWTIGPLFTFQYDGNKFGTFYGAQALWFPFR